VLPTCEGMRHVGTLAEPSDDASRGLERPGTVCPRK
jgi:hypothetical protein